MGVLIGTELLITAVQLAYHHGKNNDVQIGQLFYRWGSQDYLAIALSQFESYIMGFAGPNGHIIALLSLIYYDYDCARFCFFRFQLLEFDLKYYDYPILIPCLPIT